MNEDKLPNNNEHQDEVNEWIDLQEQALAIIHSSCERDQAQLISDTQIGKEAWETLAETYDECNEDWRAFWQNSERS